MAAGMDVDLVLVCPELLGDRPLPDTGSVRVQRFGDAAFNKVSRRQNPDGIAVRTRTPALDLSSLSLPPEALVLVAEGIEKPGNLGAMVRTAVALGVDAVMLADPVTDVYNPNVIRSSQGALFAVPLAAGTTREVIDCLARQNIRIVAAQPEDGTALWDTTLWDTGFSGSDAGSGLAIVVGSEADGLTAAWAGASQVTIPMVIDEGADSLNAATAAAILLYEAVRQRR